ncbi:MAG: MATE family efflux transporter [Porcipelethomonas sp.]
MEMEKEKNVSRMASAPVGRLMLSMGIPMILSMVLQAVYNIVDSAFVSNMKENGEEAINALTLAFPFQMLMVAIAIGTGVGANALVSKSLGQGDREKASKSAGNAMFMGIVIYAVFLLFGLFGTNIYISSQTSNPLIADMANDYLSLCCIVSPGIVFFAVFEKLLQSAGHSVYSTIAQIAGAAVNIVLDPVMIYGWLGFPEMGVKGAAVATVSGQCVSFLLALIFHLKVNKDIRNGIRYMKPSAVIIKEIYSIGLPAIIAQALMSFMTYGLNIILVRIGEPMVTAYGLYYKIQQFILFAAFGLRDAITPIISYSHGMGNRRRITDGMKYGMLYTLIIMIAGTLAAEILASPLSSVFGLSGETLELCISAMRVISISFVFAGANIAFQGIFQALGGGMESLVISICRQLVFIFPFVFLFVHIAEKSPEYNWLVWTSFPVAEILTAAVGALLLKRMYRNKVAVLK